MCVLARSAGAMHGCVRACSSSSSSSWNIIVILEIAHWQTDTCSAALLRRAQHVGRCRECNRLTGRRFVVGGTKRAGATLV